MLRAVLLAECALVLVLLLPAVPPARAALGWGNATDPDHPGTCLLRREGIRLKNGQEWYFPNCMVASCYRHRNDMMVQYISCGKIGVPPSCTLIRDLSKPYPGCCGEVSCPKPKQPLLARFDRSARHD
ncbi:hypothetical protein O3P69_003473 [Scylla paramamosain]|uniref:Single domain-containing protein n=1 Tax=Scylla paramamosain TaxID=85552 RepID=A0AAW0UGV3_SCYPA